jgi:hypothetical protein
MYDVSDVKTWVNRITRPIYRDMPLSYYNGNSRDAHDDNLFHWARIRGEVAQGSRRGQM